MRNLYRYGVSIIAFFSAWIIGAIVNEPLFFLLGIALGWSVLYVSNGMGKMPRLYWERLRELKIQLFLTFLAFLHIVPGVIVAEIFANYLWIFVIAALVHLGLEIFLILNRPPKDPNLKSRVRLARGTRARKHEIPFWNRAAQ